jgi:hypothetical protein
MTAFYKDMAARGQQDRILMMTFSEFGRRPYENGSKGTDHGAAAPMFLVGPKVKAGPVGKHPSLTDHNMGNLKHTLDFRQVYAAILDKWLGVYRIELRIKGGWGILSRIAEIRELVRNGLYYLTEHADEEAAMDRFDIYDIEEGILTGKVRRTWPREHKYEVVGTAAELGSFVELPKRTKSE